MKKKLAAALLALAAALVALWIHADREGARELGALGASAREEIAREQARLGRLPRPVLEGTPRDENAADSYPALLAAVADLDVSSLPQLVDVVSAGNVASTTSLTPAATAALARFRPTLERLRDTLRCTRCAWAPGEQADRRWVQWTRHWNLLTLLASEGKECAEKGDQAAAAELWLEAIRAESDLAGSILGQDTDVTRYALGNLQGLLEAPPGRLDHARIARDLARLEPLLPTPRDVLRRRGLGLTAFTALLVEADPSGARFFEECGLTPARPLVPLRAYLARSARELDTLHREAARVVSLEDLGERRTRALELTQRAGSGPDLVRRLAPFGFFRNDADVRRARLRLVQTAYALEAWKDAHGRYPAPGEVPITLDPFAPGKSLVYVPSPDGGHYALSSADLPGLPDDPTPSIVSQPLRIAR